MINGSGLTIYHCANGHAFKIDGNVINKDEMLRKLLYFNYTVMLIFCDKHYVCMSTTVGVSDNTE